MVELCTLSFVLCVFEAKYKEQSKEQSSRIDIHRPRKKRQRIVNIQSLSNVKRLPSPYTNQ